MAVDQSNPLIGFMVRSENEQQISVTISIEVAEGMQSFNFNGR